MKKPSKSKLVTDASIELYCQSLENLLKNISNKCGSKGKKEKFEEEQTQLTDCFEELMWK